ncbi:MAG: hypothetical protein K8J31_31420 [Anaerolineae bacterium]|nr:hypothetical protein [Anaerolineae bacterium]
MMITAEVSGKLLCWWQDVGALVERGAVLADIETDAGRIPICAPADGRLTEIMLLPGDAVEVGTVIGWIDALTDMEAPQPLSALIDPPAAPERKLKPRRKKARPVVRLASRWWMIFGLLLAMAAGAALAFIVPVRSEIMPIVATVPVIVTPTLPPLVPTPRYRLQERVVLREPLGELQWGTQGIIQTSGYSLEDGTWYEVKFGEEVARLPETRLDPISILAPTPTMRYELQDGNWAYPLMLREPVADFPAGTRVLIGSGYFDGVEWQLQVTTENGVSLNVRDSQLIVPPDAPEDPAVTPTLGF